MTIGHNSTGINGYLKAFIERIEKLEEQKFQITAETAYVYAEAKVAGFDPKIMRKVVALRRKEAAKLAEEQAMLETYMGALGMVVGTPLGDAAMKRDGVA